MTSHMHMDDHIDDHSVTNSDAISMDIDNLCLQDLFLEQVKKTPKAIAVVDGSVELTYEALDEITSKLAIQLIEEFGVGPDAVVGILLPRSVAYVISYVAILKAGGAYMPLELVYPKPLLERAVQETNAKVVLTNAMYSNRVDGQPHIVMENQAPFFHFQSKQTTLSYPPPAYVHPTADHLAFCVMSSGTTGTPKGICQTHRAAVHSYLDRFTRFPYQDGDRVGAGVFFVWELYRPLCRGATCVVIPDHILFDPPAVTDFVQKYNVTRLLVTPSLMQLILDSMEDADVQQRLANLRYLWFCGEVVSGDLARAFSTLLPKVELMNLYSISECHDVSIGDLKRELDPSRKYATCGKQIPGVKFYIVDLEDQELNGTMKQVPKGETGEVYVGGPVVGRGYLNMPEKTAERFVPNPFDTSDKTCQRLYKTGDLGRLLPNGQLEILGRCDFMVKIRGYSVVLGAIETALAKHPKLASSVVLAVGSEGSKDKKLVAYVVPLNWHDPPSASSVRSFLKDHVPTYAIPTTFCVIDALPVAATAAGKLDRKKLPAPETAPRLRAFSMDMQDGESNQVQRIGPENDMEQDIFAIWAQLLDLPEEDMSATDSFFEVGGHSLLATRMVKMVNEKYGLTTETGLSILSVVENPTIRGMAEGLQKQIDGDATTASAAPAVNLQAEADAMDPSIYPFPTRKGNTLSRFRMETSALMNPRVVFLTGATGYLGSHLLAELLHAGVTVIALARASDDTQAKERLVKTLNKYRLLDAFTKDQIEDKENGVTQETLVDTHLVAVAGDLSMPLLGMDNLRFKSLAVEIDSIIHCGAEVNLVKPYTSLKKSNVLGTQEILRLATTNGFVKTKVKPVHYISTNGIFPVEAEAYSTDVVECKEDVSLQTLAPHLTEGYAMSKWVAEQMCTIAESRGLPISILRPGNMAGSFETGAQNPDDLNYLLMRGMIATQSAPLIDTKYALDLTPVDFAAKAAVHLAIRAPQKAIGQRFHLQTPQKPVSLQSVVDQFQKMGYVMEPVSRDEWMKRLTDASGTSTDCEKLASGWFAFEKYFEASTWLWFGSDNLQQALEGISCPPLDDRLLERWFPKVAVTGQ